MPSAPQVTVVVGVDGSGRSRRLAEIGAGTPAARLVDDAHLLDDAALQALTAAALAGEPLVVTRRPALDRPALADLDAALAARGEVQHLPPLDEAGIARLLADLGRAADPAAVLADTAGLPALVVATPAALADRVRRKLAGRPAAAAVARLLALGLDLDDAALADAAGADPADALAELREAGLLDGAERMPAAVARAVTAGVGAAALRRALAAAAAALLAGRAAGVLAAAERLRAGGVRSAAAAALYRAAGERLLPGDPAAAAAWLDDALEAGEDPALVGAGRAEAAALLGLPLPDLPVASGDAARLGVARAAAAAHQGRPARAAEALRGNGNALAVHARIAAGVLGAVAEVAGSPWQQAFAAGCSAAPADPGRALPLFVEAAEELDAAGPAGPLTDTPHAAGALAAVTAGDVMSAERLLLQAIRAGTGGPAYANRHRLLLAWSRMRSGRYDTATAETRRPDEQLGGRDRLVLATLRAGLARRSGDVAAMRETWPLVEEHLARCAVDLSAIELVEELAVVAGRLRQAPRALPLLAAIDDALAALGDPPAWAATAAWTRLQLGVGNDDADGIAAAAARLGSIAVQGIRADALRTGAAAWARAFDGDVDPDAVSAAAEALAAAQLPWEGSRLSGQAAVRSTDPAAARRLLERARELSGGEPAPAAATATALSDRELGVSRLVLAGRTHREIGAQLFIAPKTVEHHVARIRAKLGATTRAEFVAALREVLGEPAP